MFHFNGRYSRTDSVSCFTFDFIRSQYDFYVRSNFIAGKGRGNREWPPFFILFFVGKIHFSAPKAHDENNVIFCILRYETIDHVRAFENYPPPPRPSIGIQGYSSIGWSPIESSSLYHNDSCAWNSKQLFRHRIKCSANEESVPHYLSCRTLNGSRECAPGNNVRWQCVMSHDRKWSRRIWKIEQKTINDHKWAWLVKCGIWFSLQFVFLWKSRGGTSARWYYATSSSILILRALIEYIERNNGNSSICIIRYYHFD